jgi:hypothetical protein
MPVAVWACAACGGPVANLRCTRCGGTRLTSRVRESRPDEALTPPAAPPERAFAAGTTGRARRYHKRSR